jgi:hypothetical protein
MNSSESIKQSIDMADVVCMSYLSDLTDTELMMRPHPECNHVNWQIGHLIESEHSMIEQIRPGSMPVLPVGFAEKYSRETVRNDDPKAFATKEELMNTYKAQRAGTLAALAKTSESELDAATGVSYAPTVGAMFSLQGSHWLMHCGQWVVIRRILGKAIVM